MVTKDEAETFALSEKRNLEAGRRDWLKTKALLLSSTAECDTQELHVGFIRIEKESPLFYTGVQSRQWFLTTTLNFLCILLLVIRT